MTSRCIRRETEHCSASLAAYQLSANADEPSLVMCSDRRWLQIIQYMTAQAKRQGRLPRRVIKPGAFAARFRHSSAAQLRE
jgi:hypothetical protein